MHSRSRTAFTSSFVLFLGLTVGDARAQDEWKAAPISEPAPEGVAEEVRSLLSETGFEVSKGEGEPFLRFWPRKATPAASEPAGSKGAVQFPFLAEGELLGVVEYLEEGYDYRDQSILEGAYTLRYLLQPINGDHLGVSVFRDYGLLVPADLDQAPEPLERKPLERESAEASGTNHPAVLLMTTAPEGVASPAIAKNEEKGLTGVVVPLLLQVAGGTEESKLDVQFVIDGAAPL